MKNHQPDQHENHGNPSIKLTSQLPCRQSWMCRDPWVPDLPWVPNGIYSIDLTWRVDLYGFKVGKNTVRPMGIRHGLEICCIRVSLFGMEYSDAKSSTTRMTFSFPGSANHNLFGSLHSVREDVALWCMSGLPYLFLLVKKNSTKADVSETQTTHTHEK